MLSGCDLFTTRDPEKPDENRANFQPPKEPSIVIENLKNSFNDKNTQNYIACFVDTLFVNKSFTFIPSSEAVSTYAFLAQDWGLDDERRYFNSVIAKVPKDFPITLTFSDESYSSLSGDTLVYSANYFLNIPHNSSEPKNYSGNLQFNMIRDNRSDWSIYYWKDTRSSSLPSWSEMKGIFY
ncbi:Hypothetical protein IALB_2089 [Ignavibacterium album JCM 16511]|uniref:Uncharacterized protein n=1 Tax=Ignavibacterium album (strain DSM 19864 / JCM 16511 / NBRC 101810 / Mat9-16) TaxID=945713 RepID=I0ALD7_IGNAJ|nr:hypothetical protein [Ignavibacterium album]AFH49794.1 Hypothetical protein IALB_2089 [Ignavibacterium album JCM 16511]